MSYGGVHGLAQVGEKILGWDKPKSKGISWYIRVICCFCFVTFAWVFFRAKTVSDAVYVLMNAFRGVASPVSYVLNGLRAINIGTIGLIRLMISILPLVVFDYFVVVKIDPIQKISEMNVPGRYIIYFVLIVMILFLHSTGDVAFVYFQF